MADVAAGAAVRAYRRRLGLGPTEAAARWGMPLRTLEKIEAYGVRETYAALISELIRAGEAQS